MYTKKNYNFFCLNFQQQQGGHTFRPGMVGMQGHGNMANPHMNIRQPNPNQPFDNSNFDYMQ